MQADWVAVGSVGNAVQIKSIDYGQKVIHLTKPLSWRAKAPVWLVRDSRGQRVLHGTGSRHRRPRICRPRAGTLKARGQGRKTSLSLIALPPFILRGRIPSLERLAVRADNARGNPLKG
ncbi:MAG: hypothetical protein M0C28_27725 [Candidatus Moduliflexus flocculans]|nr:hypothetical protein [Candidatus Moduliflexus flocculans]